MKICLLTLAEKGGMIQYASQLSNYLSRSNDVSVIIPENMVGVFKKDVNVVKVPTPLKYFSLSIFRFYLLIKAVNELNPDIIHITSLHPWLIFTLPFLKRKYPIVTTIHDVKMHLGESNYIWDLSLWILKRYSDKIFVHGQWALDALVNEGIPKNKIKIVPLGNLSSFNMNYSNNLKEKNSILFFGRIEDYKGLEYLIKVEPLIRKEIPNFKVIIAGEGDFTKYSKFIRNWDAFEIYNEFIPDNDIPSYFQRVELVVLPYTECTQTGIIPIAYAFKKPVIATNVGSIPEVVEDGKTGFIVPAKDHEALAETIIKILNHDDLRMKMGCNGYIKMEKELSWNIIAEKLIKTYTQFI